MTIGTRLFTWWRGELVGTDAFGNSYYRDKRKGGRRWVLYNGPAEASMVPADWHGWLHYTVQDPPTEAPPLPWQKQHEPNLTGTPQAYKPSGAVDRSGRHAPATGDYEPWRPD
jgi:NADH:ubiquinone oxidoreductase subunit